MIHFAVRRVDALKSSEDVTGYLLILTLLRPIWSADRRAFWGQEGFDNFLRAEKPARGFILFGAVRPKPNSFARADRAWE